MLLIWLINRHVSYVYCVPVPFYLFYVLQVYRGYRYSFRVQFVFAFVHLRLVGGNLARSLLRQVLGLIILLGQDCLGYLQYALSPRILKGKFPCLLERDRFCYGFLLLLRNRDGMQGFFGLGQRGYLV